MSKEQMFSEKNIELHHHSLEEIMGEPPAGMVRIGSGVLLLVIAILMIGLAFFTLPDTIETQALLCGGSSSAMLIAPQDGKIIRMKHPGKQTIHANDTIMWVRTAEKQLPVVAATSGFLEINPLTKIKQYVHKDDTVGLVWKNEGTPGVCLIHLPADQATQVRPGNKIRLSLDIYPSKQYGMVETQIRSISRFNSDKEFQIIAELPDSIVTTNQFGFVLRGNLYGTAEIITGESSLFYRLINPFKGLVNK